MWRLLMVVTLAGCPFPNHNAADHPTEPLAHQMPARVDDSERVRGVVHIGDEMFPTAVQFAAVELVHAGLVMRSTNTDHEGRFLFADDVPLGVYEVRVTGEYVGSTRIDWRGRSNAEVEIRARPR